MWTVILACAIMPALSRATTDYDTEPIIRAHRKVNAAEALRRAAASTLVVSTSTWDRAAALDGLGRHAASAATLLSAYSNPGATALDDLPRLCKQIVRETRAIADERIRRRLLAGLETRALADPGDGGGPFAYDVAALCVAGSFPALAAASREDDRNDVVNERVARPSVTATSDGRGGQWLRRRLAAAYEAHLHAVRSAAAAVRRGALAPAAERNMRVRLVLLLRALRARAVAAAGAVAAAMGPPGRKDALGALSLFELPGRDAFHHDYSREFAATVALLPSKHGPGLAARVDAALADAEALRLRRGLATGAEAESDALAARLSRVVQELAEWGGGADVLLHHDVDHELVPRDEVAGLPPAAAPDAGVRVELLAPTAGEEVPQSFAWLDVRARVHFPANWALLRHQEQQQGGEAPAFELCFGLDLDADVRAVRLVADGAATGGEGCWRFDLELPAFATVLTVRAKLMPPRLRVGERSLRVFVRRVTAAGEPSSAQLPLAASEPSVVKFAVVAPLPPGYPPLARHRLLAPTSTPTNEKQHATKDDASCNDLLPQTVLGVKWGGHDSAAAVVVGGRVVAVLELERLAGESRYAPLDTDCVWCQASRVFRALRDFCAQHGDSFAGLAWTDGGARRLVLDVGVLVYDEASRGPFVRWLVEATKEEAEEGAPNSSAIVVKRWVASNHHASHASLGFFDSPFARAIILSVDGKGRDRGIWGGFRVYVGARTSAKLDAERSLAFESPFVPTSGPPTLALPPTLDMLESFISTGGLVYSASGAIPREVAPPVGGADGRAPPTHEQAISGRLMARQNFAEHFFGSNALHCTAMARILIPAECSAVS